jgi:hypothetical protein
MEMSKVHALAAISAFSLVMGSVPVFAYAPPDTAQFNSRESQAETEQGTAANMCGHVASAPGSYSRSEVDYCRESGAHS